MRVYIIVNLFSTFKIHGLISRFKLLFFYIKSCLIHNIFVLDLIRVIFASVCSSVMARTAACSGGDGDVLACPDLQTRNDQVYELHGIKVNTDQG